MGLEHNLGARRSPAVQVGEGVRARRIDHELEHVPVSHRARINRRIPTYATAMPGEKRGSSAACGGPAGDKDSAEAGP